MNTTDKARSVAVYLLMLIGGVVGWVLFTCLSNPLAAGRMDSAPLLQYVLLFDAVRRILRSKRWLWGIFLVVYSALLAYVFPIVTYIT